MDERIAAPEAHPLSEVDQDTKILQMFKDIRQILIKDGNFDGVLSESFKIEEIPADSCESDEFLGLSYFHHQTIPDQDLVLTSAESVKLQIRDREGLFFPLVRLVPTLLHEFAHVITEVHRKFDKKSLRFKKRKKLEQEHFAHDNEFYENFRRLLKAAELLEIYRMPPSIQNKYNTHSLRRFDAVNHLNCPMEFCGSTSFPTKLKVGDPVFDPFSAAIANLDLAETSSVVVCVKDGKKGVSKSVQLKERTLEELKKLVKQKFRAKPQQFRLARPQRVLDSDASLCECLSQPGIEIMFV